jgi:hypothetical protein
MDGLPEKSLADASSSLNPIADLKPQLDPPSQTELAKIGHFRILSASAKETWASFIKPSSGSRAEHFNARSALLSKILSNYGPIFMRDDFDFLVLFGTSVDPTDARKLRRSVPPTGVSNNRGSSGFRKGNGISE